MRISIAILVATILTLIAFMGMAMAGNPLEKDGDFNFLHSDPDGDLIETIDEFIYGTDPFNTDSDNDGLPDYWELQYSPWLNPDPNALMDPTDPTDSHEDFDYLPRSNGSSYNMGEQEATFIAVKQLKGGQLVAWPSHPDNLFITPVFDEQGPHYDNYEEYYRPYTDVEHGNVIRYMQTNPTDPDTDGDLIVDPDDWEPLGWANDGTSPGGSDINKDQTHMDDNINGDTDSTNSKITVAPEDLVCENYEFDIIIDHTTSDAQQSTNDNKNSDKILDVDNDGI